MDVGYVTLCLLEVIEHTTGCPGGGGGDYQVYIWFKQKLRINLENLL
jgi:hypothetical protein